jgi:DNA-binding NarL/FixJ family response regulator
LHPFRRLANRFGPYWLTVNSAYKNEIQINLVAAGNNPVSRPGNAGQVFGMSGSYEMPKEPMMKQKYRILIVDDHTLFRAGVRALLTQDPGIEVVGEAANGRDAIRAVALLAPHLVLMDLSMPSMNGMEAMTEIKRRYPDVRVLVMTLHKTEDYIHASLNAGADGYILKDATQEEFLLAIRSVLLGKTYLSMDVSAMVVSGYLSGGNSSGASGNYDSLTHREREVLKLVAEGKSNKDTAEFLSLSVKTVEKHRSNLMSKLALHNASGLTTYAMERGLVVR